MAEDVRRLAPNVAGDEHIVSRQMNGSTFDPERLRDLLHPKIFDGVRSAPEYPRGDTDDKAVGEVVRQERRDHARTTLNQRRSDPLLTQDAERHVELDPAWPGRHHDDRDPIRTVS